MKKLLFSFLALLMFASAVSAQDEDPEKSLKKAAKDLGNYNLDTKANVAKLDEAKKAIDYAVSKEPTSAISKTWLTKGQIYSAIAESDATNRVINPSHKSKYEKVALEAFNSYKKALELAQKKWEKSDALKGITGISGHLRNLGADAYQMKDYKTAYQAFNNVVIADELLVKSGEKAVLQPADNNLISLYAAVCALSANMKDEAKPLYKKLYDAKHDDASVYQGMYDLTVDTDEAAALNYLAEGRKRYPEESSLLFTEINHYLKKGKLDELIDKLKLAISKEPNNISLYNTLGNVYDNLYQRENEKGNTTKAQEYFDLAKSQYELAYAKDAKSHDSLYSLGALYYNKAAQQTKELNKLADDYSKEGVKKYDAKKKEIDDIFAIALPYFQKAEAIEPNDRNTLIALKEIFARSSQVEKSNEFKKRLENIEAGKKNESYFKN